jgi:integrase
VKLHREKLLKRKVPPSPGKAFTSEEKTRMLDEARKHLKRSPNIYPALVLALNAGLRDKESRELRWEQIDMVDKKTLVVGQSKTDAGTGRVVPLNRALLEALIAHATWHTNRFKECKPEWFVFAFGRPLPCDPTRHATTFKTVWTTVRANSAVSGRWHDNRHTLVTELAESGAGDEIIMSIAGHVRLQMISRYSHVRNEAKRKALEEIYTRQTAAEVATRKRLGALAQAQQDTATSANVATALAVQ